MRTDPSHPEQTQDTEPPVSMDDLPSTTRRSQARRSQARQSQGWHSRGYLPHCDVPGLVQHVTFHLADSLPRKAIDQARLAIAALPEQQRSIAERQRIQSLLDSGLGSCVLRDEDCAQIVEDSLLFGDGERYHLLAWVIMPNHVHVMIEQIDTWPLAKIVQSWKRHTSRRIHTLGPPSCTRHLGPPSCTRQSPTPLWQRDYWDRYIRSERHFMTAKDYIDNNPVQAGLVTDAEHWPWGSARFNS